MKCMWVVAAALGSAVAQDSSNHVCPTEPPSQVKIDEAVSRGCDFLRSKMKATDLNLEPHGGHTLEELLLAALAYGGVPEENEDMQWLLKRVLDRTLQRTYEVVLLAVALDKLDPEFYLGKLVECAQFLLDNQCENGQWSYGRPIELQAKVKKLIQELREWGELRRKQKTKGKGGSTKQLPRIELTTRKTPTRSGDNSNTQFAALGLRICGEAGIALPKTTLELAREWWLDHQESNGSWGYTDRDQEKEGQLAMTAGGVGSLILLQSLLDRQAPNKAKDTKSVLVAKSVEKGMKWLGDNFTFHVKRAVFMKEPYTHYSIERAGVLSTLEKIGPHPWYAEGAADLLRHQKKDGSWRLTRTRNDKDDDQWAMIDTAIAILFFKKSVRPPVATGGEKDQRPK